MDDRPKIACAGNDFKLISKQPPAKLKLCKFGIYQLLSLLIKWEQAWYSSDLIFILSSQGKQLNQQKTFPA